MTTNVAKPVTGRRLACSTLPPRTTPDFAPLLSSPRTPQPLPSSSVLDTPGALLEGLRCFAAFRPFTFRNFLSSETRETKLDSFRNFR